MLKTLDQEIQDLQQQLTELFDHFPDKRNDPGGAVDALHRSRDLAAKIQELKKKQTARDAEA